MIVVFKNAVFIKFVVSLTIVNNNPLLRIVKKDPSLAIVNIFIHDNFFQYYRFFKNGSLSFL